MTNFEDTPLSILLKNRDVFRVFDSEFQKVGWLDASVLVDSESTIKGLYTDHTVPHEVLDRIVERLRQ